MENVYEKPLLFETTIGHGVWLGCFFKENRQLEREPLRS